jgi:branched-chain amino acid transport system permease protein
MAELTHRARSGTLPVALAVMAALFVVPFLPLDTRVQFAIILALIYGIAAVALDMFIGYAGQLSFGNFGFVAAGAYISVIVATDAGWNVWATLPLSILFAAFCGLVIGIPMVRLGLLGAALVTFFFSFITVVLISGNTLVQWTRGVNGIAVPTLQAGETSFFGGTPLYFLAWGALLVVVLISSRYANSRAGRALRVVKRGTLVAASLGINVNSAKLSAFVYSAGCAGLAGFIFAQAIGYLAPETFPGFESVFLVTMLVVGGLGSIAGPIVGAVVFFLASEGVRAVGAGREMLFAILLLVVLVFLPAGIYGGLETVLAWLRRLAPWGRPPGAQAADRDDDEHRVSVAGAPDATAVPAVDSAADPKTEAVPGEAVPVKGTAPDAEEFLELDGVHVTFGGLAALQTVGMSVARGEIYAIMGPNGAGKTTLLNCISGIQSYTGEVRLERQSLHGMTPTQVRRIGVSRTFQHPSLVGDLTVLENVEMGSYGSSPASPFRDVLPTRSGRRRDAAAHEAAVSALDLVGFPASRRTALASDLTLAEQKVVDIARSMSGGPRLLLLDEPTAGLSATDIDKVATVLRTINERVGLTIVVIAHHVGFLRSVARRATVLDFGRVLATGTTDEVTRRPDVSEVFLGVSRG